MSDTIEKVDETTKFVHEDGDDERFSHYVRKEDILSATIEGIPVRAICGKKWVPTKDPERFPICPDCQKVYEGMQ